MPTECKHAFVLGSGGFLGSRILAETGAHYVPFGVSRLRNESDLPRFESEVEKLLQNNPQNVLVNCIGSRQSSLDRMMLLNARIPESLVKITAKFGSRLVHFGSASETTQVAREGSNGVGTPPAAMLAYGITKQAGTQACLNYEKATVLRVYNLYGLPHQTSSGLHQLCRSVRTALINVEQPSLVDTTRDYVHWKAVCLALRNAIDSDTHGLIEVSSGVGISMSQIIEGLPLVIRMKIVGHLKAATYFAPVIGPPPTLGGAASSKSSVIDALREEVMTCAFS